MNNNYKKAKRISEKITELITDGTLENDSDLKRWIMENNSSVEVVELFTDEGKLKNILSSFGREEKFAKAEELKQRIESRRKIRKLKYRLYSIASAIIAISLLVWNKDTLYDTVDIDIKKSSISTVEQKNINSNEIQSPKVVLSTGEEVEINQLAKGATVNVADILSMNSVSLKEETKEPKICKIIVPRKYSLKVELPDGTKVFLNADSELSYIENFSTGKREVVLRGEAFFDVAKSDNPFVVICNGVAVKVYGTKFNVNGYTEGVVHAALVEGVVGVSLINNAEFVEQVMVPNQYAVVNCERGESLIMATDVSQYVSWMQGFYRYDSRYISDMLEELSRWYDVDFVYETQNLKSILVTASLKRDLKLEEMIKHIERVTKLKFIKEGGKYIVDSFE